MQSWQTRLNERKLQFLTKTRDRLAEIRSQLDELAQQRANLAPLTKINKTFHQLAGAGGIYEMNDFCNLAISAEELCSRLLQFSAPVGDMEQSKLRGICDSLEHELEIEQHRSVSTAMDDIATMDGVGTKKTDLLLIDQNHDRLLKWHRVFEENKLSVRTVRTGSGARGALLIRVPDVVVIAAPLPDSPLGLEVIQHIRNAKDGDQCVVLLVAENVSFKNKVDALKTGADALLDSATTEAVDIIAKAQELLSTKEKKQYKILSVEDDPEQAFFIKSTLEAAGYAVLHIPDPHRFEDALTAFAPDLVLLDIMLGDISGHDLARFLRQHEQFGKLPIVFLTTENQLNMHVESAKVGGDEHLLKPIAPQLLIATIAGRLDRA